jgi:hypothetical protein
MNVSKATAHHSIIIHFVQRYLIVCAILNPEISAGNLGQSNCRTIATPCQKEEEEEACPYPSLEAVLSISFCRRGRICLLAPHGRIYPLVPRDHIRLLFLRGHICHRGRICRLSCGHFSFPPHHPSYDHFCGHHYTLFCDRPAHPNQSHHRGLAHGFDFSSPSISSCPPICS